MATRRALTRTSRLSVSTSRNPWWRSKITPISLRPSTKVSLWVTSIILKINNRLIEWTTLFPPWLVSNSSLQISTHPRINSWYRTFNQVPWTWLTERAHLVISWAVARSWQHRQALAEALSLLSTPSMLIISKDSKSLISSLLGVCVEIHSICLQVVSTASASRTLLLLDIRALWEVISATLRPVLWVLGNSASQMHTGSTLVWAAGIWTSPPLHKTKIAVKATNKMVSKSTRAYLNTPTCECKYPQGGW